MAIPGMICCCIRGVVMIVFIRVCGTGGMVAGMLMRGMVVSCTRCIVVAHGFPATVRMAATAGYQRVIFGRIKIRQGLQECGHVP